MASEPVHFLHAPTPDAISTLMSRKRSFMSDSIWMSSVICSASRIPIHPNNLGWSMFLRISVRKVRSLVPLAYVPSTSIGKAKCLRVSHFIQSIDLCWNMVLMIAGTGSRIRCSGMNRRRNVPIVQTVLYVRPVLRNVHPVYSTGL